MNEQNSSGDLPVFSLEATLDAVPHKQLPSRTRIFSIHDMEYYLWIRVNPEIAKNYTLYGLDEVGSTKKYDINLGDICYHETNRIWYRLNSMMLNRNSGQHVYRMHFVNRQTESTISLYFSYIVQTENPEKPYLYMPDAIQKQKEVMKL